LLASPTLFTDAERRAVTSFCSEHLVQSWGVQSLADFDSDFHPRHLDLERYYYDEAYHNGDVWLWLSGSYVSALPDPPVGFQQTRMLLDEILDEGAVGTLQEIRDGAAAASNDEFGGATSQAWSLSELLRTVVDDYLGLRVDLTAKPPLVHIDPRLPPAWDQLVVRTRIGEDSCQVYCRQGRDEEGAIVGSVVILALAEPLPGSWLLVVGDQALNAGQRRAIARRSDDPAWPHCYEVRLDGPAAR
jgi:glycogen debranching enzyme